LLLPVATFGQLAGTVRDSASKLPVAGVKILVSGPAAKALESNDTGRFQLEAAPPGAYTVRFSKQGYDPGVATLEVKAGADPFTLEIRPWAEVEGTILDEDGRPLEGIPVYVGGLRDTSGKDGRYHAKDISGGRYLLSFQLPYELRRTTAIHNDKTGETFGYANTLFYPGVADRKLAGTVIIEAGAHLTNFDVRLRRTALVELKGRLSGALAATQVELDSAANHPDQTFNRRTVDAHGGFRFDLLPAGTYTLLVYRNRPGDDLPYITTVALGSAGVQDLEIVLPSFVRLEGTVRTVRADLRWEGKLRLIIGRNGYETEVRVASDGTFGIDAIPPGEWTFMVDDTMVHRADDAKRRLYALGSRGKLLHVTEGGNLPLTIELTDETGRISGTTEGSVLVGVRSAGDPFTLNRVVPVDKDRKFIVELAPGDYRVVILGGADCASQAVSVTVQGSTTSNIHLRSCSAGGN
jgi:hypothetical protein